MGKPKTCNPCCSGGAGGSSSSSRFSALSDPTGCPAAAPICIVFPAQWQVTIAGIANGTCASCSNFNGTHVLTRAPEYFGSATCGKCSWIKCGNPANKSGLCACSTTLTPIACIGRASFLSLQMSAPGGIPTFILQLGGHLATEAEWQATVSDCFGSYTLSRTLNAPSACTSYPLTVALSPA